MDARRHPRPRLADVVRAGIQEIRGTRLFRRREHPFNPQPGLPGGLSQGKLPLRRFALGVVPPWRFRILQLDKRAQGGHHLRRQAVHRLSHVRSRDTEPRVRLQPRRPSQGEERATRRHTERRRRRRLESIYRHVPAGPVFRGRPFRQGRVQGGVAAGVRPAAGSGQAADRHGLPLERPERHRRAFRAHLRERGQHLPRHGPAVRRTRLRRSLVRRGTRQALGRHPEFQGPHRLFRKDGAPDRSGRGFLHDAEQVRALRPQPDVLAPLCHAPDSAPHRGAGRHNLELRPGDRRGHRLPL